MSTETDPNQPRPRGPQPPQVEIRRRKLMSSDCELYDYIEAHVAARELDRVGGDASGAVDGHAPANRVWGASGRWSARKQRIIDAESTKDEIPEQSATVPAAPGSSPT